MRMNSYNVNRTKAILRSPSPNPTPKALDQNEVMLKCTNSYSKIVLKSFPRVRSGYFMPYAFILIPSNMHIV